MPLREDVEPVVRSLPAMAIGEWGCIQSGEVTQVIDADEVMLEKCQLIDADEVKQAKKRREQELTSEAEARADAERDAERDERAVAVVAERHVAEARVVLEDAGELEAEGAREAGRLGKERRQLALPARQVQVAEQVEQGT